MLKTNRDKLPVISVQGQVAHPTFRFTGKMTIDGKVEFMPGTGGITYNAKIGDPACGWAADHLEPGATTKNPDADKNAAYVTYACIGNEAVVISGDAKGAKGFVTGKHGGCEHLMIYFDEKTLDKMAVDDKVMVKACGQGLKLSDYPDIMLRSVSPALLDKMNITGENGKLKIGAAKMVPAAIMGSGLGHAPTSNGDYDITLFDRGIANQYGLMDLRFGDIVAVMDADTRYGRNFYTGAVTIGVIAHSDCVAAGHGPGVTTLFTCKEPLIEPFIDEKANLANFFIG